MAKGIYDLYLESCRKSALLYQSSPEMDVLRQVYAKVSAQRRVFAVQNSAIRLRESSDKDRLKCLRLRQSLDELLSLVGGLKGKWCIVLLLVLRYLLTVGTWCFTEDARSDRTLLVGKSTEVYDAMCDCGYRFPEDD